MVSFPVCSAWRSACMVLHASSHSMTFTVFVTHLFQTFDQQPDTIPVTPPAVARHWRKSTSCTCSQLKVEKNDNGAQCNWRVLSMHSDTCVRHTLHWYAHWNQHYVRKFWRKKIVYRQSISKHVETHSTDISHRKWLIAIILLPLTGGLTHKWSTIFPFLFPYAPRVPQLPFMKMLLTVKTRIIQLANRGSEWWLFTSPCVCVAISLRVDACRSTGTSVFCRSVCSQPQHTYIISSIYMQQ